MTTDLRRRNGGFTLVELMIALVLGLIVVGGSLALFVTQRVTNRMSGQMSDVQAEGRIAMDGMARDIRAAGDFGCWPVANPIDGRLNQMVFDVTKGGIKAYLNGTTLPAAGAADAPYGLDVVRAANPDANSGVLVVTGINGTLTRTSDDMADGTVDVVVKTPLEPFKAHDIAVVTDCVNWAKFQVTDVLAGSADKVNLKHAGGALSGVWGQGNQDGNIGAKFRKDSSVGRLDSVWWFIGTVNNQKGLYRLSARDGAPALVSARIYAMQLTYDLDTNDDAIADDLDNKASDVGLTDWPKVRSVSLQMLVQSEKTADAGGKVSVTEFAGVTVPTDKYLYLPLQMNVAVRNQ
ncbi:hypothetical protein GCM10027046_07430 [Uliginosibacterium flavum]|uniref:Prepilin-type N-terminal cleavage/methylation domain-containing protein n=1 Tax=Uliginosibacterium flavum TaxID=1396831 RepID=A0ABV2TMQ1_9RHOO